MFPTEAQMEAKTAEVLGPERNEKVLKHRESYPCRDLLEWLAIKGWRWINGEWEEINWGKDWRTND